MRLSWAQGAIVALSLTAAIGLLDTPARLLGPASVAESPLEPPARLDAVDRDRGPADTASARADPSTRLGLARRAPPRCSPPSCRRWRSSSRHAQIADSADAARTAQRAIVAPRRRTPPDEPRPTPAPAPVPVPVARARRRHPRRNRLRHRPTRRRLRFPQPTTPLPGPVTPPPILTPAPPPAGESSGGDDDSGDGKGGCPAASANGQGGSHDAEHGHEPHGKACGHNG